MEWIYNSLALGLVSFCVVLWVFVGGALLFVGGRYIVKTPRAKYWKSVWVNIVSSGLGVVVSWLLGYGAALVFGSDIFSLLGLVAGLLVTWWVIKIMFKVSFCNAIGAWGPVFFLDIFFLMILLAAPYLIRGNILAKEAVCRTRIHGFGASIELYHQGENEFPPSIKELVVDGYASPEAFKCPSDIHNREISYFYLPSLETEEGGTFVMCDLKGNHVGKRNVLHKTGHVAEYSEEEFQAELAKPYNARFAEALKKAEGP